MTPEERFITNKFHRLSMAIFNQAVTDIQLTTTSKAVKNDAWRWLLNDGYRFYTDLIGFNVPTDKYLKMLQSIRQKPPKPKKTIKKDPETEQKENLDAIQAMGLQVSLDEFSKVLEKVRKKGIKCQINH
jgi:hypothetical protein